MGGRLHAKSRKEKKNPIGIHPKARQIWTRKDDLPNCFSRFKPSNF